MNRFDKRWLEWDGEANQLTTRDKKYIFVDSYARWRIADPLLFMQRLRDEQGAQSRLDDIIDGEARNVIAAHNLIEIVRTGNRQFDEGELAEDGLTTGDIPDVKLGREKLSGLILERASKAMPDYGIELVDVRVKRVNYVNKVQEKVFERMIAERKRIADRRRSEGQGKSAEIRGKKQRELKRIQSEAYRKAQEVKGKADALAADIYAKAYNDNPRLYAFLKTLEMYRNTIDKDSTFVLSTDGDLYKYFQSAGPSLAKGKLTSLPGPLGTPALPARSKNERPRRSWQPPRLPQKPWQTSAKTLAKPLAKTLKAKATEPVVDAAAVQPTAKVAIPVSP